MFSQYFLTVPFKTKHGLKIHLSSSEKNPLQCRVRMIFTFSPVISYLSRSTKLPDQLPLFTCSSLLNPLQINIQ